MIALHAAPALALMAGLILIQKAAQRVSPFIPRKDRLRVGVQSVTRVRRIMPVAVLRKLEKPAGMVVAVVVTLTLLWESGALALM